ncbi:hypothetical protein PG994_006945 [Apiospora phragmitis]|uniref:WSC domain-containing protein n=1 Tax=Apiospora phragmitis TaxID=2905665 RepID=A0ABR1VGI5_9PEZI
MRAYSISLSAVALAALPQQALASMAHQRHLLSKRDTIPRGLYNPNTIKTCSYWYDNYEGLTCHEVRDWMWAISPADFSRWNPTVTEDCGNWQELSYCPTPTSTTTPAKPTLLGWNSLGCYVDSNTLSTRSTKAGGDGLTVDKCKEACFDDDFEFAGVKAGTECWCGTYVNNDWTNDQQDCNIPCAGNQSQICGGSDVFNIFGAQLDWNLPPPSTTRTTSNHPPSATATATSTTTQRPGSTATAVPTWQAVGCYRDLWPAAKRTLAELAETNDQTLTPGRCQSTCRDRGYSYAGVENGRECWCGDAIQDDDKNAPAAEEACSTRCTGDSDQACGGPALVYLYRWTAETAPTWVYLGCYGEEVGRILPHELPVPGGQDRNNTRAGCIEDCGRAGYVYAGLENGRECWCDNEIRQNGQLASDGASAWLVTAFSDFV